MSSDNTSNPSATPTYLDIANTARSLILYREKWQEKMIGEALRPPPFSNFSSRQLEKMDQWEREKSHLKTIAEERTDKVIQELPEKHRQAAKEDVQKILDGRNDTELNRVEKGAPVWSQQVNSLLGQELGNEARARAQVEKGMPDKSGEDRSGQMTITHRSKDQAAQRDAGGSQQHKEVVEQQIRNDPPPPPIDPFKGKD